MTKLYVPALAIAVVMSFGSFSQAEVPYQLVESSMEMGADDFQPFMEDAHDRHDLVAFASRVVAAEKAADNGTPKSIATETASSQSAEPKQAQPGRSGARLLFDVAGVVMLMGLVGMVRVWTRKK